jgi:rhamnosyltransferase
MPVQEMPERKLPSRSSLLHRTGVVIPTLNAAGYWSRIKKALEKQGIAPDHVLIVDSSSSDNTCDLVRQAGYRLKVIPKESFRHGATRQLAAELMPKADFLVYLTQDASCGERSLENLLEVFNNPKVGGCYGRQLPRAEAGAIERHGRLFNYPATPALRTFQDRKELGFRAAYFSNSFAAYRRTAFDEVGGFPRHTIVSEEVTVAARMLIAGWTIAYQADATVIHSHDLTIHHEFSRYFDIGVHHGREQWLLEEFGDAGGEGRAFIRSETRFLLKNKPSLLPLAMVRNASKWCAYQLGRHERYLPQDLKEALSAQQGFWLEERRTHEISHNNLDVASTAPEIPRIKT